jgi:hypothetical protein
MAKARPFTNKVNTKSLIRKFKVNKRADLSLRGRLRFRRRRLRLIVRARLAAVKLIPTAFRNKKKRSV